MTFTDDQIAKLNAKLSPNVVKPARAFGPKGDYIEGWFAIQEANRIFGFDGWSYIIADTKLVAQTERAIGKDKKPGWGVSYIAHVEVIIGPARALVRQDVGSGHGYDLDLGMAHESAIKEAVTDALKRALRSFGNPFGLALYDKTREHVGFEEPPAAPAVDRILTMIDKASDAIELGKWMGSPKVTNVMDTMTADDLDRIAEAQKQKLASFERAGT